MQTKFNLIAAKAKQDKRLKFTSLIHLINLIMGHKTSKENLARKLKEIKGWVRAIRGVVPLKVWWPVLKAKLAGHFNYFGISGNYRCLKQFYDGVKLIAFKWINRRSQKKSMNWKRFMKHIHHNPLPEPRICYSLYT